MLPIYTGIWKCGEETIKNSPEQESKTAPL
jgi:hypothetical protein